jgi:hypothetical protein
MNMISILFFFFVFLECMYTVCPNIRRTTQRSWIFSRAMSHVCANDEYRPQVGATNRPENIVIRYISVVSL